MRLFPLFGFLVSVLVFNAAAALAQEADNYKYPRFLIGDSDCVVQRGLPFERNLDDVEVLNTIINSVLGNNPKITHRDVGLLIISTEYDNPFYKDGECNDQKITFRRINDYSWVMTIIENGVGVKQFFIQTGVTYDHTIKFIMNRESVDGYIE